MKLVLSLAALAAVARSPSRTPARSRTPPEPRVQLVEVEQQTPYLESFAGDHRRHRDAVGHPPRRQHRRRRVLQPGLRAVRQPERRRQSRATFPLEVEDGDTYGVCARSS